MAELVVPARNRRNELLRQPWSLYDGITAACWGKKKGECMRILVCGSRDWTDREVIRRELTWLISLPDKNKPVVIHGEARGADSIAGEEARRLNLEVAEFPADWKAHGKAAGPIRNQQMIDEGKPDVVLAFTKDITTSRGTANMVRLAIAAGLPVRVFS